MVGSFSLLMFVPLVMNVALARELGAKDGKQGFFQQKALDDPSFLDAAMKKTGATSVLQTQSKVEQLQDRLAMMEKMTEEFRSQLADAMDEEATTVQVSPGWGAGSKKNFGTKASMLQEAEGYIAEVPVSQFLQLDREAPPCEDAKSYGGEQGLAKCHGGPKPTCDPGGDACCKGCKGR